MLERRVDPLTRPFAGITINANAIDFPYALKVIRARKRPQMTTAAEPVSHDHGAKPNLPGGSMNLRRSTRLVGVMLLSDGRSIAPDAIAEPASELLTERALARVAPLLGHGETATRDSRGRILLQMRHERPRRQTRRLSLMTKAIVRTPLMDDHGPAHLDVGSGWVQRDRGRPDLEPVEAAGQLFSLLPNLALSRVNSLGSC
jgi:hypothetical protein